MRKLKDSDYAAASARIRAVEKNLINREKIEKLLDAGTDDILKILAECDYGDGSEIAVFEELLTAERRKTFSFIRSLLKDSKAPDIVDIFCYQYDYHNLKVILKNSFLLRDHFEAERLCVDCGTIPVSRLIAQMRENDYGKLTPIMRAAVEDAYESHGKTANPQQTDIIMDMACYKEMAALAATVDSKFIGDYVAVSADVSNIKTFMRLRRMGKNWVFMRDALLTGGKIPAETFIACYEGGNDAFVGAVRYTDYGELVGNGMDSVTETGNMSAFERMCDNYLGAFVRKTKYIAFGIEVPLSYLLAKENEIKCVRIIMSGKAGGVSNEYIRERLRETYV